MTVSELNIAIQSWIASVVGTSWVVIFGNQNAPRPAGKYITIRLSSVRRVGWDVQLAPDPLSGIATVVGNREWMLFVQAFGIDAMSVLYDLQASFNRPTQVAQLFAEEVIYIGDEGVLSTAELFGSNYEERASLDVSLRTTHIVQDVILESVGVGFIDSVNGTGIYHTLGTALNRLERALTVPQ